MSIKRVFADLVVFPYFSDPTMRQSVGLVAQQTFFSDEKSLAFIHFVDTDIQNRNYQQLLQFNTKICYSNISLFTDHLFFPNISIKLKKSSQFRLPSYSVQDYQHLILICDIAQDLILQDLFYLFISVFAPPFNQFQNINIKISSAMSKNYAEIEKQLSKFAEEFDKTSNKPIAKPKVKKVKKPVKQDDSFEKFQEGNLSKELINSARKWKDTSKDEKKSKGKYKTFWRVSVMVPEDNKDQMKEGQPQIAPEPMVNEKGELISSPTKPLGPYMLFHIEKSSEQKYKKLIAISQSKSSHKTLDTDLYKQKITESVSIYEQWNEMTIEQKDKYYYEYQTRLRKYNALNEQFLILTDKKRILNPYNRFYKKMYGILEVEGKYSLPQMTKMIKQKWAVLNEEDKRQFQEEYQEQMQQFSQTQKTKFERIKTYRQKLAQYEMQEQLQKLQILSKFNLVPKELDQIARLAQDEKILRNFQRKQERQRKKQRFEKAKKAALEKNYKRIIQLRQKQILELKLQNYQMQGIPREIFQSTPSKMGPKIFSSSTTMSKSKKQNDSDSKSQSQSSSVPIQISSMNKTKKIMKQTESTRRQMTPGASTFKKLLMEMKKEEND